MERHTTRQMGYLGRRARRFRRKRRNGTETGSARGIRDNRLRTGNRYQLCFESAREKELVFVHKTVYDGEIHPSDELDGGRFWSTEEIKENIGKGIFTPNFEQEIGRIIQL